jgi:SAM-dependent methyltransferase
MRKFSKSLLIKLLSIDAVGRFSKKLSIFFWKIKYQRDLIERKGTETHINEVTEKLFKDKIVLHGPFKDLLYPGFRSRNSSLFSKLIGSYETELHPVFEEIIKSDYTQILDIGCAEGYYAVGLALKMPKVKVVAYDIETEARELTAEMAKLNKLSDRVDVQSSCTEETLKDFKFDQRSLIISDCEGYERALFTGKNLSNLKHTDILIETHDWVNINISTDLENLFAKTHDVSIIRSIGDVLKAKHYKYDELANETLETKYRIFEEGRGFTDEWLWIKARK